MFRFQVLKLTKTSATKQHCEWRYTSHSHGPRFWDPGVGSISLTHNKTPGQPGLQIGLVISVLFSMCLPIIPCYTIVPIYVNTQATGRQCILSAHTDHFHKLCVNVPWNQTKFMCFSFREISCLRFGTKKRPGCELKTRGFLKEWLYVIVIYVHLLSSSFTSVTKHAPPRPTSAFRFVQLLVQLSCRPIWKKVE